MDESWKYYAVRKKPDTKATSWVIQLLRKVQNGQTVAPWLPGAAGKMEVGGTGAH